MFEIQRWEPSKFLVIIFSNKIKQTEARKRKELKLKGQ